MPEPKSERIRQLWANMGKTPQSSSEESSSSSGNVSLAVDEEEGTFTLTVDE